MSDEEARTQSPGYDTKSEGPVLPKDARRNRKTNEKTTSAVKPLVQSTPNESIAKLPRHNPSTASKRAPKIVPHLFQRGKRDSQKPTKTPTDASGPQTTSVWAETDDTPEYRYVEDPLHIKLLNCLMFCGLAQNSEILWNFAKFTIERGGYFYIIIYLFVLLVLVTPVSHLEIFVGQWCQSGIVKTMRSYGKGFEFIGIVITMLLFFRASLGVHNSYPVARHIVNLIRDGEAVVTCRSNQTTLQFEKFCVSLVNDMKCKKEKGPDFVSYGPTCTNSTAHITQLASISQYYAETLRTIDYRVDYDITRLLYLFVICVIIAVIGAFGFNVIRYFVAIVYAYYIFIFIIMFIPFVTIMGSFSKLFHRLSTATTPESLFEPETYGFALYHAIQSAGLGLSAFLCASSFRSRKGNSFGLTYVVVFVNILFGIVGLFYMLCVLNNVQYNIAIISKSASNTYNGLEGLDFISGTLTEVFMARGKSVVWLLLYNVAVLLISVSTFCGCFISLCGFVRDHFKHHQHLFIACAAILYALAIFMYTSIGGWQEIAKEWRSLTHDLYDLNIFMIIIMMIVVFIHIYGSREYIIDLCEVFTLQEGQSAIRSATNSWQFVIFNIVPFICLFIQANLMPGMLRQHARAENIWSELLTNIVIVGLAIVAVVFFGWRLYNNVRDDRGLASFFTITPEHISFKRISSGWKQKRSRESVTPP